MFSVVQDHVAPDLLFAGTEFGLFFTVDGGRHWVRLRGGLPTIQVRDLAVQKRENDLVLGTFGRSFYILDDYSPLREVSAEALAEPARLLPLRDAYLYNVLGQQRAVESNWTAPNPPYGAVFTYHVAQALPENEKVVLTIADESGRVIRNLDGRDAANSIPQTAGINRFAWNLRADAPPPTEQAQAGGARGGGGQRASGGGQQQGPVVAAGRYRATLGTKVGEKVTPLGPSQTFALVEIRQ